MKGSQHENLDGGSLQLSSGRTQEVQRLVFGCGHPAVGVVSGVHGDEFNGVAIAYSVARLLKILPEDAFVGRVEIYPAVNPDGLNLDQRRSSLSPVYVDMNRLFSAERELESPAGARATALLAALKELDLVLDLHSSSGVLNEVNHVKVVLKRDEVGEDPDDGPIYSPDVDLVALVRRCNLPAAICYPLPEQRIGVLSHELTELGVRCLVMEGGTTSTVEGGFVRRGTVGVLNILEAIGAVELPVSAAGLDPLLLEAMQMACMEPSWFGGTDREWVSAPEYGVFLPSTLCPGDYVYEGEPLGEILATDLRDVTPVLASRSGYLLALRKKLPTHEGAQVGRILGPDHRLPYTV